MEDQSDKSKGTFTLDKNETESTLDVCYSSFKGIEEDDQVCDTTSAEEIDKCQENRFKEEIAVEGRDLSSDCPESSLCTDPFEVQGKCHNSKPNVSEEKEQLTLGSETIGEEQESSSYFQNNERSNSAFIDYFFHNVCEMANFQHPDNKYFIGCKWSPDGTCLLTNSADYNLRILELPHKFHGLTKWCNGCHTNNLLNPVLQMKEGGLIYDYDWYPFMSSWNPPTCCFISTSAGSPVHLWDAYTGEIRASYKAYDYADEVHAALSIIFSNSGEDIYCGFRNLVKVFDVSTPGRQCETFNLKGLSGHKGIVSCIAENPSVPALFAVGTFNKTIGLYTRSNEFVCMLNGQRSGLTQLKFSEDGSKLFSGARMDNEIIGWDVRNLGKVLFSLERVVTTNQRIYFDLAKDNKYLISGGTDGKVRIFDVQDTNVKYDINYLFKASNDCLNGVSVHSSLPILATASGQKHHPDIANNDDDDIIFSFDSATVDNCIKLWWAGTLKNGPSYRILCKLLLWPDILYEGVFCFQKSNTCC